RHDNTPRPMPETDRRLALGPLWRGHVFLFDKAPAWATYGSTAAVRVLLLVVGLEAVRLALNRLQLPSISFWLQAPLCLGLALLAVRFVAGLAWSQIGFHRWAEWNAT